MVTKYDVFEIVYKNKSQVTPAEVAGELNKNKSEHKKIYRILNTLKEEDILSKTEDGFRIKRSDKTQLLYELIYYCTRNNINYNLLLDKNLASFIHEALKKRIISAKGYQN